VSSILAFAAIMAVSSSVVRVVSVSSFCRDKCSGSGAERRYSCVRAGKQSVGWYREGVVGLKAHSGRAHVKAACMMLDEEHV
jgi:hypothetical protein